MDTRNRRHKGDLYTAEQIKRVLNGSGIDIANEIESDFILFCPFHNNSRTPAGEVSKTHGTFFCFSCQTSKTLVELVMHASGRSFFEATRFIKDKHGENNIETVINKALYEKPVYVQFDELILKRLANNV